MGGCISKIFLHRPETQSQVFEAELTKNQKSQRCVKITLLVLAALAGLVALGALVLGPLALTGNLWVAAPAFLQTIGGAITFWGAVGMSGGGAAAFLTTLGLMIAGICCTPKRERIQAEICKIGDQDYDLFTLSQKEIESLGIGDKLNQEGRYLITRNRGTDEFRVSYYSVDQYNIAHNLFETLAAAHSFVNTMLLNIRIDLEVIGEEKLVVRAREPLD